MRVKFITLFFILLLLHGCNTTKYVRDGEYMLTKVNVQSDNKLIRNSELKQYIKQEPNHKTFGFIPVPLYLYNMSGSDTTKWINRFLRKAGTGPCIYDEALKDRTERELKKVMANKGYIYSEIESNVITKKKKATVNYFVRTGIPLVIDTFSTIMPLDTLGTVISNELKTSFIKTGDPLDRSTLEKERVRISSKVRNVGYWGFNKDYINYTADTIDGNNLVALQMNVLPYRYVANEKHLIYKIQKIYINTDYNPLNNAANRLVKKDTVEYKGFNIVYGEKKYLTENVLTENCFIMPGAIYSDRMVDATYNAFARLQILKYVNIRFEQSEDYPDQLICNIYLTPGKNQTIQTELEGTNSAGDLGFAAAVTYQHRNIFKGSETFTAKVRGGYENLTGDVSGLIKDNYTEYGLETGLSFPKFLFPFISSERKKRIRATTDVKVRYNYQHRPEYTRVIAGGGFNYSWLSHRSRFRHTLDVVDVSYVYLPYRSDAFIDSIIDKNPITYSSYKDHLITRTGYSFNKTNFNLSNTNRDFYSIRLATEIAGNTLYGLSSLFRVKKKDGDYTIAGLRFEQYWKLDADYAFTKRLDYRNSLAFHIAGGIGIPYGNSSVLPFEKRYYSGGANGVRGWSVRTLGPGRFNPTNESLDYFNQCGDIRLDGSIEYRSKLFWKLEMAAFVDAGNVWTIKKYENQPGGEFNFKRFYREIAVAWGLGVRFDFDYFLIRMDMGIKAYDPTRIGDNPWVIKYPYKKDNMAFHFAVGYPF